MRSPSDTRRRRPLGRSAVGVSSSPSSTTATVTHLNVWRLERVELPPGPDVCPPWCEWCYAPNWLAGWWWR
jgi:hypothetical protein